MHVTHPILLFVLLVADTACIVKANVIFYQILDEVNSKLPPERQFSSIFVNVRSFAITGEHARLFPESQRRKLMYFWGGIGFALGLMALFSGSV